MGSSLILTTRSGKVEIIGLLILLIIVLSFLFQGYTYLISVRNILKNIENKLDQLIKQNGGRVSVEQEPKDV